MRSIQQQVPLLNSSYLTSMAAIRNQSKLLDLCNSELQLEKENSLVVSEKAKTELANSKSNEIEVQKKTNLELTEEITLELDLHSSTAHIAEIA
jgi:hypothetical protein